jgi:DNA invertase Pin-like site-specific DNA recombinase
MVFPWLGIGALAGAGWLPIFLPNTTIVIGYIRFSPYRIIWLSQLFGLLMSFFVIYHQWALLGNVYIFPVIFAAGHHSRHAAANNADGFVALVATIIRLQTIAQDRGVNINVIVMIKDLIRLGANSRLIVPTLQFLRGLGATVVSVNQWCLDLYLFAEILDAYFEELKRISSISSQVNAGKSIPGDPSLSELIESINTDGDRNHNVLMNEEDSRLSRDVVDGLERGNGSKLNVSDGELHKKYKAISEAVTMIETMIEKGKNEESYEEAVICLAKKFGYDITSMKEGDEIDMANFIKTDDSLAVDQKKCVVLCRQSSLNNQSSNKTAVTRDGVPIHQIARATAAKAEFDPDSDLCIYNDVGSRHNCHPGTVHMFDDIFAQRASSIIVNDLRRLHACREVIILVLVACAMMGIKFIAIDCLDKVVLDVADAEVERLYLRLRALNKRNDAISKLVEMLSPEKKEQYLMLQTVAAVPWYYHLDFGSILRLFGSDEVVAGSAAKKQKH